VVDVFQPPPGRDLAAHSLDVDEGTAALEEAGLGSTLRTGIPLGD